MLYEVEPTHAIELILEHTRRLRPKRVPLAEAVGLALADDLPADESSSAWSSSTLSAGRRIDGVTVCTLALRGLDQVRVVPTPRVAVVSIEQEEEVGGVPHVVGQMTSAMVRQQGIGCGGILPAYDDLEDLSFVLDHVHAADVVLFALNRAATGDVVSDALAARETSIVFRCVRQQPSSPFIFAVKGARLFFGLPSEPDAALICFELFVAPALRKMMGHPGAPRAFQGQLVRPLEVRTEETQVMLASTSTRPDGYRVDPLVNGSSRRIAAANTCLCFPPGYHRFPAGADVEVHWLGAPG
jgi:molybdopterin molybdotransferase